MDVGVGDSLMGAASLPSTRPLPLEDFRAYARRDDKINRITSPAKENHDTIDVYLLNRLINNVFCCPVVLS